jgi:23S rRNA pseudouridine955/2504/2580 synthase
MSSARTESVAEADGVLRLDRWFRRHYPSLSHAGLEKLLRTGQIRVDGRRVRASERLAPGQSVRIPPSVEAAAPPPPRRVGPEEERLAQGLVLYRDEALLVLNKPPGLAVQGGSGERRHVDGLLDALRFGAQERPRLVHRLDKETSGVLVVARTAAAAAHLARAFRDKRAKKIYWALVAGVPKAEEGRIDLPLVKAFGSLGERVRFDAQEGKRALTLYRVLDSAGKSASFLLLMPLTGRTHQLRVHCAALGTAILGDRKYGGAAAEIAGFAAPEGLHLHARALALPHPAGGTLRIAAPLPAHMRTSLDFFGFASAEKDPFADLPPLP